MWEFRACFWWRHFFLLCKICACCCWQEHINCSLSGSRVPSDSSNDNCYLASSGISASSNPFNDVKLDSQRVISAISLSGSRAPNDSSNNSSNDYDYFASSSISASLNPFNDIKLDSQRIIHTISLSSSRVPSNSSNDSPSDNKLHTHSTASNNPDSDSRIPNNTHSAQSSLNIINPYLVREDDYDLCPCPCTDYYIGHKSGNGGYVYFHDS